MHNGGSGVNSTSSYNIISRNNVTDNANGIYLRDSLWNNISRNSIENNSQGIYIYDDSNYNNIIENNITTNILYGVTLMFSSNNSIYHNNFVKNVNQTYTYGSVNTWNDGYPSGGNYWSNYIGVDFYSGQFQNEIGSDGIGDTSHDIDIDNEDGFPLMGPFSFFNACVWDETTYYVHTVSNSTISDFYFSRDDKLVSFNVNGTVDTTGFCRVTIPRELMWCDTLEEWNVTVNDNPPTYLKAMEDADHTYLYFTYNHTIHNVEITSTYVIPEFLTWASMLLILIVLTFIIAIYKRRLLKQF